MKVAKKPLKNVKLTLTRSPIGCLPNHRASVKALGLRKLHQSVFINRDNPSVWGMVRKVSYLLKIEEC